MKLIYHVTTLCIVSAVVLGILLFQGCTKEDNTNCGIALRFKYDYNTERKNLLDQNVSRIELYIYDSNGNFIETQIVQASQLPGGKTFIPNDYLLKLQHIKPGTYTIVVWGNVSNAISTPHSKQLTTSYTSSILSLNTESGGAARTEANFSLFWGSLYQLKVLEGVAGTQEYVVDLRKFSNEIKVTANGFPVSDPQHPEAEYKCVIVSKDGSYHFDGTYAGDDVVTYHPFHIDVQNSNTTLVLDFNILRELASNLSESQLIITYTPLDGSASKQLVVLDLVETLIAIAGNAYNLNNTGDLDRDDRYHILLNYDFTFNTVDIFIHDWLNVINNRPLR